MLKRLKYGFPLSIVFLIISKYVTEADTLSVCLLLLSTFTMAFSLSEEIIRQRIHIKIAIILLFTVLIVFIGGLLLPFELEYGGLKIFELQVYFIVLLMAFIATSFMIEKIMIYIKVKTKVKEGNFA